MKKLILLTVLFLTALQTYPDWYITRGPNPGEIYFMGTTHTGIGLYHSTDYGMTAQCMDSTIFYQALRITADKTPGVVYYVTMVKALYRSDNYGITNSWQYVNNNVYLEINSGVFEGFLYNAFVSHSEDYGNNFIPHSYNGFFGSTLDSEIDNEPGIGYVLVNQYGINDSVFLLKSIDNFENLELQYSFFKESGFSSTRRLSRGIYPGELFFLFGYEGRLFISQDYGASWIETNKYNKSDIYICDLIGGRTEGEIYTLYRFGNMADIIHTYILHSTDYGITYSVYHPFALGQEPLLSQFSAKSEDDAQGAFDIKSIDSIYYVTGDMPLSVQFFNYSIGDINLYEWDFDNDGTIDSYEENPVYTYADTGWYSVKLTVYDGFDTSSFLRENYVYVYEITGTDEISQFDKPLFSCHPNPFTEQVYITFSGSNKSLVKEMFIYDIRGRVVRQFIFEGNEIVWDGTDDSGLKCSSGIYFISLNNHTEKILLTN